MTGSVIGIDTQSNEPVSLSHAARLRGLYVIGKPGSSKTTLFKNLILQDIEQGMGLCFLDVHGDATSDILACLPARREQDVILLDLLDKNYTFGLNIFACNNSRDKEEISRIVSSVIGIFAKLFTESGDLLKDAPNMAETLQNVIPVLLSHQKPCMTMAEIPLLLNDQKARQKLLAPLSVFTHPYVQNFWSNFNKWKPDMQENLTSSTRRRVGNFLIDSFILEIIGQSETTLPFRKILDEQKILLVKLSRQHELLTSLVGSVIVSLIANAAFSRVDIPESERVQFNLYADEYQRFCTPTFAELISEARKFKIATSVAHQFRDQLDHANRGATLNAANMIVFEVSGKDAEELAKQFTASPPEPLIIGQRATFTYKHDVINHLLRNGHTEPLLNAFVQKYLLPAHTLRAQNADAYILTYDFFDNAKTLLSPSEITLVFGYLNTLLYNAMAKKETSPRFREDMLLLCSKIWGFYYILEPYYEGLDDPAACIKWQEFSLLCEPDFEQHLEKVLQTLVKRDLQNQLADFKRCVHFLQGVRHILHLIADHPIMAESGQYEPIIDRPRTYQDVENEIASSLVNLPKYTARVKLVGDEQDTPIEATVKTIAPESGISQVSLAARIERIKTHNISDGYLRKRDDAELEISARQRDLVTPDKKQQQTKQEDFAA